MCTNEGLLTTFTHHNHSQSTFTMIRAFCHSDHPPWTTDIMTHDQAQMDYDFESAR